jgi:hypothetical protein
MVLGHKELALFHYLQGFKKQSGAFLTRDPDWEKNQDPDSGSGMNNPDHFPERLGKLRNLNSLRIRDP